MVESRLPLSLRMKDDEGESEVGGGGCVFYEELEAWRLAERGVFFSWWRRVDTEHTCAASHRLQLHISAELCLALGGPV
jgi:hypothetical protein